ncbi:MAG TPA: helix-turn-helix transcriptional regulator [Chloroflexota bacterium]|nr:helix-turn-helix transcriptional regulator [Chloroflexota bacterium]
MDTQPFLPLSEPVFFILLSLAPGPQHGYAIMKETAVSSNGRVQLSTSTLYSAIKRLLEQGWIERAAAESGVANGRERKAYQLTEQGRRLLNAEINRLQSLVAAATQAEPGMIT